MSSIQCIDLLCSSVELPTEVINIIYSQKVFYESLDTNELMEAIEREKKDDTAESYIKMVNKIYKLLNLDSPVGLYSVVYCFNKNKSDLSNEFTTAVFKEVYKRAKILQIDLNYIYDNSSL